MQPANADAIARAQTAAPGLGYMATTAVPAAPPPAAPGQVGRSTGPAMALPAPPPSMISNVPPASQAQTLFMEGGPAPGHAGGAPVQAAGAATMYDPTGAPAPIVAPRRSTAVPTQPANNTMVIGTPVGYSTRPPRKGVGIVLIVLLLVVAAGGGVALALLLRGDEPSAAPEADAGVEPEAVTEPAPAPAPAAAPDAGTAAGAAVTTPDAAAPPAPPAYVKVRVETDPPGAVAWLDGVEQAPSPVDIDVLDDGATHQLVLKKGGCKDKVKEIKGAAQTMRLELECEKPTKKRSGKGKGTGAGTAKQQPDTAGEGDGLMKPKWRK
jgi:hypothetical protein